MSNAATATCSTCGATFEVAPSLRERYPGWTPSECPACYRDNGKAGSGPAKRKSSRDGGGSRGRAVEDEGTLTIIDVLERYTEGPDSGVFTDGSAIPNPGPGGYGAVYVVDGEIIAQDYGHDPDTTNNRMEMQALIAGFGLVPEGTPATVWSDSRLCVQTLTEWAAGWERRGWKRKSGPIANLELVQEAYEIFRARPELDLRWIKAHAGYRWNEYADALATAWMREEL